jgi:hypothetical protein
MPALGPELDAPEETALLPVHGAEQCPLTQPARPIATQSMVVEAPPTHAVSIVPEQVGSGDAHVPAPG